MLHITCFLKDYNIVNSILKSNTHTNVPYTRAPPPRTLARARTNLLNRGK